MYHLFSSYLLYASVCTIYFIPISETVDLHSPLCVCVCDAVGMSGN
jgi:hypothetical protein